MTSMSDDQQREKRAWAVEQARHSSEMEGGRTSEEVRALQDRYVRGEVSADELVALTKEHYGLRG